MRIGIPRAIHYFYWPGLWERLFKTLGMEVVVSPATSEVTVQRAGLISEPEQCLPAKLLEAHVESLLDEVDYIFVPRLFCHLKGHIACTKMAPLPDALRCRLTGTPKLLTVDIDEERKPFMKSLVEIGMALTRDRQRSWAAAREALANGSTAAKEANRAVTEGFMVMAHPYIAGEAYFTGPILRKLEEMLVPARLAPLSENPAGSFINWETSNRMYDFLCRLRPGECSGVIHLSCFNCGCDSMTIEFFREIAHRKRLPYLVLLLDEHASWGGVETRLEAFVDSVRWRR